MSNLALLVVTSRSTIECPHQGCGVGWKERVWKEKLRDEVGWLMSELVQAISKGSVCAKFENDWKRIVGVIVFTITREGSDGMG